MANIYETELQRAWRKLNAVVYVYPYGTLKYWLSLGDADIDYKNEL